MSEYTPFKQGDRVKVIDTGETERDFVGEYGYILSVAYSHGEVWIYEVELDCGAVDYFNDEHLY